MSFLVARIKSNPQLDKQARGVIGPFGIKKEQKDAQKVVEEANIYNKGELFMNFITRQCC
jgi:hypothetical protein